MAESTIRRHRHPTDGERKRDTEVMHAMLDDWSSLPEPRPDLPTWLNGATKALLILRDRTQPDHSGCPSTCEHR